MKVRVDGEKLYAFLKKELKLPAKELKNLLESGACKLNGTIERFGSTLLEKGDTVLFNKNQPQRILLKTTSLPILFEDKDLLICNKPSGLESALNPISKILSQDVFLVHRLDKETSGVLILAKNRQVQKEMEALFRKREVQKIYVALVSGQVSKQQGKIENFLAKKNAYHGQTIWGKAHSGQKAITYWTLLEKGKNISFVQCQPVTGRTHQIRVHLSEMGHPIVGDLIYGRHESAFSDVDRLYLHAYSVSFKRVLKKEPVKVIAPIPPSFKQLFKKL